MGLTSNKGSADFQQQFIAAHAMHPSGYDFLYQHVIKKVSEWGNENNLMFVIGATKGDEFAEIRKLLPNHFLLVPGVGFQGGSLEEVSKFGMNKECGLLVNASRAIIYAGDDENFTADAKEIAMQYQVEMGEYLPL